MRPHAHGLGSASPIIVLLILTLTLGLPITAERTHPPYPEHTQYLQLPILHQGPQGGDKRAASDGPPDHKPTATVPRDQAAFLASKSHQQTTYYRCPPNGGEERCGWHVPVVKAEAPRGVDTGVVVAAVFGAAAMFAMGLV